MFVHNDLVEMYLGKRLTLETSGFLIHSGGKINHRQVENYQRV